MDDPLKFTRTGIKKMLVAVIFLIASGMVLAQHGNPQSPPSQLPAKAKEAMEKGLAAAKQQDFKLAVKHFTEAYTVVQYDFGNVYPQVYFNLGLAESKIPHHELKAIAWLNGYLASSPDAPNTAQVRAEINALKARFQKTLQLLADQAKQMVANLLDYQRGLGYWQAAEAQAMAGDMEGAKRTIAEQKMTYEACNIATHLALTGDVPGALEFAAIGGPAMAMKLETKFYCCSAYDQIAAKKAEQSGDATGVDSLLGYCTDDEDYLARPHILTRIGVVLLKAGKKDDADRTFQRALEIVRRAQQPASWKDQEYFNIGINQARAGDFEGALKTASLISEEKYQDSLGDWVTGRKYKEYIYKETNPQARQGNYLLLAYQQVNAGDFSGATQTSSRLTESKEKKQLLEDITKNQQHPEIWERRKRQMEASSWAFLAQFSLNIDIQEALQSITEKKRADDILSEASFLIKKLSEGLIKIQLEERKAEEKKR